MTNESVAHRNWRIATLIGAAMLVSAVAAAYLDELTHFRFEFIDDYFDIIAWIGLIGFVVSFVGCIGWARHLEKYQRLLMAVIVFLMPFAMLIAGYPIEGLNVHGASAPVMLLTLPATLLAFILLLMAEMASRRGSGVPKQ